MLKRLSDLLLYRPLTFIGLLIAVRNFFYGAGYLVPTTGFEDTVLYQEMSQTIVHPFLFGVSFLVMAIVMVYALLKRKNRLIRFVFSLNAFIWLFAFLLYALSGVPVLGFAIAGFFSIMSGYLGMALSNRKDIALYNALEE